ncbi:MAG: hypothetical protein U5L75_01210 [Candidatus Campbellbacteria bacterium]|nr:hypothetical protein [Candidatus Campbellbacteria bacterium]
MSSETPELTLDSDLELFQLQLLIFLRCIFDERPALFAGGPGDISRFAREIFPPEDADRIDEALKALDTYDEESDGWTAAYGVLLSFVSTDVGFHDRVHRDIAKARGASRRFSALSGLLPEVDIEDLWEKLVADRAKR